MGYINDFRAKLRAMISEGKIEEAVNFAADTCLESYRNGLKQGSGVDEEDVSKARRFADKFKKK